MGRPSDLARALSQAFGAAYAEQKPPLTITQLIVMRCLHGSAPQNQTEIATLTSIDRSTLAAMVATLERHGYVTRHRGREDTREVRVSSTMVGRTAAAQADIALASAERRILNLVPKWNRTAFLEGLTAIAAGAI